MAAEFARDAAHAGHIDVLKVFDGEGASSLTIEIPVVEAKEHTRKLHSNDTPSLSSTPPPKRHASAAGSHVWMPSSPGSSRDPPKVPKGKAAKRPRQPGNNAAQWHRVSKVLATDHDQDEWGSVAEEDQMPAWQKMHQLAPDGATEDAAARGKMALFHAVELALDAAGGIDGRDAAKDKDEKRGAEAVPSAPGGHQLQALLALAEGTGTGGGAGAEAGAAGLRGATAGTTAAGAATVRGGAAGAGAIAGSIVPPAMSPASAAAHQLFSSPVLGHMGGLHSMIGAIAGAQPGVAAAQQAALMQQAIAIQQQNTIRHALAQQQAAAAAQQSAMWQQQLLGVPQLQAVMGLGGLPHGSVLLQAGGGQHLGGQQQLAANLSALQQHIAAMQRPQVP